MATDNSSSLSKDETIEQLKETVGQLEAVIQKLEETTVVDLPSSESLQNLSTTTSDLETIIAQEAVSQESVVQEAQAQIPQEVETTPELELELEEVEPEVVPIENTVDIPEQSDEQSESENSSTEVAEAEQGVVAEAEQEVAPIEQIADTPEQDDELLKPTNSSTSIEPETPEARKSQGQARKPAKQSVETSSKQTKRTQKKGKQKNQVPKKKNKLLVGALVAAIAVLAISLTLKFAPILELPQLIADNPKTSKSVIKSPAELPLESPKEIAKITKDSKKIDFEKVTEEKIASQPNEVNQVEKLTQAKPKQIDPTPSELDSNQQLLASEPEEPEESEQESDRFSESEEESEESLGAIEEEPKPITKLTSEQNLIVALGKKTDNLAEQYSDEMIVAISPDFATSVVSVTLSDDWYQLVENRQDRLLGDMFRRSQQLEFLPTVMII